MQEECVEDWFYVVNGSDLEFAAWDDLEKQPEEVRHLREINKELWG